LNKKVYIIILNYNGWQDTIECLESVLKNDYNNYQIIVIDNNSPNNSMEYLIKWAKGELCLWLPDNNSLKYLSFSLEKKPIEYIVYTKDEAIRGGDKEKENKLKNPIIFIQAGENRGFAAGNNIGIKYALAKDDFDNIILLNNDTVIEKKTIKSLINVRLKFGDKAIYSGIIYYYLEPKKIWYDGGHFNQCLGRATHTNMRKMKQEIRENDKIKAVNFITFCYVLIPKHILENIGLLDESYFMYVEDLDYSYRVWNVGYKLYHVSISKVWHKVGASSGEDDVSEFSAYWYYKNTIKIVRKNIKGIYKYSAFSFILLKFPILFIKWTIKNKQIREAMIKGYRDGFKN